MTKVTRTVLDEVVAQFSELEDPRSTINRQHPLVSVVVIALMAVLAMFRRSETAIAIWAESKKNSLRLKVLSLLPRASTPQGCFPTCTDAFEPCGLSSLLLQLRLESLYAKVAKTNGVEQPVFTAVDGKTLRRSSMITPRAWARCIR